MSSEVFLDSRDFQVPGMRAGLCPGMPGYSSAGVEILHILSISVSTLNEVVTDIEYIHSILFLPWRVLVYPCRALCPAMPMTYVIQIFPIPQYPFDSLPTI